jgi:hypothetical protein
VRRGPWGNWRIKSGAYRSDSRPILLLFAFWPVVIAISVFSLMFYLLQASPQRSWALSFLAWQALERITPAQQDPGPRARFSLAVAKKEKASGGSDAERNAKAL